MDAWKVATGDGGRGAKNRRERRRQERMKMEERGSDG